MSNVLFTMVQIRDCWHVAVYGAEGEWQGFVAFTGPHAEDAASDTVDRLNDVLESARRIHSASLPENES